MKRLILVLLLGAYLVCLLVLSSCSSYTCPTYSNNTGKNKYNVGKATMVKQSNIYYNRRY